MNVLRILAVVLVLAFTMTIANTYACDKHKTSAKSECSTEMKKTSAKGESSSCCSSAKTASVKSDCCSTTKTSVKTASVKSECCSSKKDAKLEAVNTEAKEETKTAEVKPINN